MAAVFSWPFYFALERGNIEAVTWLLLAGGVWAIARERWMVAAVLLGVAASVKIYPGLMFAVFLRPKRWKEIGVGLLTAVVLTLASLRFLEPDVLLAWHGVVDGVGAWTRDYAGIFDPVYLAYDHSAFELLKALVPGQHPAYDLLMGRYLAVAAGVTLVLFFGRVIRLPRINQVLFVTVASVLLPPASFDYTLVNLYVPFAWLVLLTPDERNRGCGDARDDDCYGAVRASAWPRDLFELGQLRRGGAVQVPVPYGSSDCGGRKANRRSGTSSGMDGRGKTGFGSGRIQANVTADRRCRRAPRRAVQEERRTLARRRLALGGTGFLSCAASGSWRLRSTFLPLAARSRAVTSPARQLAIVPGFDVQLQGPIADAADLLDVVADLLEHFAQLAIAALGKCDLEPWIVAAADLLDLRWSGDDAVAAPCTDLVQAAAIDHDATAKLVDGLARGHARDLDQVRLEHACRGFRERVGEVAVVRHQQKALGEVVEPTHGVEPRKLELRSGLLLRKEVGNRGALLRIDERGDVAAGLVEHEIAVLLRALQKLSVDTDVVLVRICLGAQLGDGLAVYLHAALEDDLLGLTPRGDASLREDLLEALAGGFDGRGGRLAAVGRRLALKVRVSGSPVALGRARALVHGA